VDSLAAIVVYQTGAAPALLTVYATGSIGARYKGSIYVSGPISNAGQFIVADGDVEATSFLQPTTGLLRGYGRFTTMLASSGRIDIFDELDPMGGLHVTGTFQQYSPGQLVVDLNTNGGKQCDTLLVSGSASLDGTLELRTAPGFTPTPGDVFMIIHCGSRTGTFSAVTWNGNPLTTEAAIAYEPNSVSVVIGAQPSGVDPGAGASRPREVRLASNGVRRRLSFALDLPEEASVQVKIFDVRGREAATLFDGVLGPGQHELAGPSDARLASGTYFARAVIQSNGRVISRTARAVLVH
jgi:hypothetical protein